VRIAKQNLDNATESLSQDQAKFKSGTISAVQLQTTQVTALRARYTYTQSTDSYLRALASLSTASGVDQIGLKGGAS
jgi:outer membrane protein